MAAGHEQGTPQSGCERHRPREADRVALSVKSPLRHLGHAFR